MNSREDTSTQHAHAAHPQGGCCSSHAHDHHSHDEHDHESSGCCGGQSAGSSEGGCCGGGSCSSAPREQIQVFSRKQIRELDRLAVEEFAMPGILLMENAARGIAGVILEGVQGISDPSALIICGPGNNGGDGLAVARHLANRNMKVAVILSAPESKYAGDALTNLRIVQKMDLPIFDAGGAPGVAIAAASALIGEPVVVIDALFGTGLDRAATGPAADLIEQMNGLKERGSTLVAIDVPSGLDCDTGEPAGNGPAVKADLTIALAGIKAGFLSTIAQQHVGELVVVEIGVPKELVTRLGRPLTAPKHG